MRTEVDHLVSGGLERVLISSFSEYPAWSLAIAMRIIKLLATGLRV